MAVRTERVEPPDGPDAGLVDHRRRGQAHQTAVQLEALEGASVGGTTLRSLQLCAGYDGFSLALRGIARSVCYVERDAYAASVIISRIREGQLDDAPIWDDIETFDGAAWNGSVDLITAGIPCQPFSAAGLSGGVDDDRWIWSEVVRIIGEVGPRYVFLENVPQLVRHGLPYVLDDLARLGFDAEWGLYSAADVGAPHKRERFWLVAHAASARLEGDRSTRPGAQHRSTTDAGEDVGNAGGQRHEPLTGSALGEQDGLGRRSHPADITDGASETMGNAAGERRQSAVGPAAYERKGGFADTNESGEELADAACLDEREPHDQERAESRRSQPRHDLGRHRFPPLRDDVDGWEQWNGPQPGVRRSPARSADGLEFTEPRFLPDRLHLLGNGLVPQCARAAWLQLVDRLSQ